MSAHHDISSLTGECCCCPGSSHHDGGGSTRPGVPCDYCKGLQDALPALVRLAQAGEAS